MIYLLFAFAFFFSPKIPLIDWGDDMVIKALDLKV